MNIIELDAGLLVREIKIVSVKVMLSLQVLQKVPVLTNQKFPQNQLLLVM